MLGSKQKGSSRPRRAGLVWHMYTPLQVKPQNVFASDDSQGGGNILSIIYSNNKPLPQVPFYSPDLIRYFVNRGRGEREKTIVVITKMISTCFRCRSNHHTFPSQSRVIIAPPPKAHPKPLAHSKKIWTTLPKMSWGTNGLGMFPWSSLLGPSLPYSQRTLII